MQIRTSGMLPRLLGGVGAMLVAATAAAEPSATPKVASINLCADQLVLTLADPAQIATVSWLAADPEESMLAEQAARYPLNYGTAEELLHFKPDVVVAGAYTNAATRRLLTRLGYRVIAIEPAASIAGIEQNIRSVAAAINRPSRGDQAVERLRAALPVAEQTGTPVPAVVVRPGGFTVGAATLADALMQSAGLRNVAAAQSLDRWGTLSIETLLRSDPQLLIFTAYRRREASLANAFLEHPALRRLPAAHVTVAARYWSCGLPESLESVALLRQAAADSRP